MPITLSRLLKFGPNITPQIEATLPKQTPAGKYLLRVDQVYPGVQDSVAQIYPACAHIEVESDVNGELPKGIQIEEALSDYAPGMDYF